MKPRRIYSAARLSFPLATALVALLAASQSAFAQGPYYWDNAAGAGFGTAGGAWTSTASLWSSSSTGVGAAPGTIVSTTATALNFGTAANALNEGTITITGGVNAGNLTYGSLAGNVTLTGGTITLPAAATITVNNSTQTIASALSGATISLTKAGVDILRITGANGAIMGGNLIINAGEVQCGNGSGSNGPNTLGAADGWTVQLGATSGSSGATLALGNSFSLPNPITVRAGSSGTKTLGIFSGSVGVSYTGAITADDNLRVLHDIAGSGSITVSNAANTVATDKTVTFSLATLATLTDSATWSGQGKLAYSGSGDGTIIVSGAKTHAGGSTLGSMSGDGTVVISTSSTGPANAPTNGVFGTGTLTIGSTRLRSTTTGDRTVGNPITFAGSPIFATIASEKSLVFSGNADLGASSRTLSVGVGSTVPGKMVDFQGAISSATAASGITKAGTGVLTLSGANTYTGNTTVTGGTLNISGGYSGNPLTSKLLLGTTAASTVVNVSNDMTLLSIAGANLAGSSTAYNQSAGTVNVSPTSTTDNFVARTGYGSFNLTGGIYKQNSNRFSVTDIGAATGVVYVGGTGTLDLTTTSSMIIGYTGAGSLTVGTGGSVNRNGGANQLWLTTNTNSTGTINMAGGSMDTGTVAAAAIRVGNNTAGPQTGFINLAKGTLTMGQNVVDQVTGTGTNLYANYAGGTLKASAALNAVLPATSGALTVTSTLFGPIDNTGAANDFAGGLTVDTNGFAVTHGPELLGATGNGVKRTDIAIATPGSGYIGAPLVTFTGGILAANGTPAAGYAVVSAGAVTDIIITSPGTYTADPTVTLTGGGGSGASVTLAALTPNPTDSGLTKISAGTLSLTAVNTYAGPTLVSGGTLALSVSGSVNSSGGITVDGSGAKLLQTSSAAVSPTVTVTQGTVTGNGTINTVNVGDATGNIISNNDGAPGAALTIGALTFNGAATVNTFSSSTVAPIVTTTLTGNGTAGQVAINPSAVSWAAGTYDLISFGSVAGTGGLGQFTLGTVTGTSPRQTKILGNSATAITLTIGADDQPYWVGGGDDNWNLASTNNWKLSSNDDPALFLANDNVLFNDDATGSGPISVNISENVAPNSATFDNATKDYVLDSTGGFGISSGLLVKSGNGKLTINTANTYDGGTTVNGGTLVLGNANAIGTGTLTLAGGNLDSSVADLVNAGNNVQAWNSDFTFVGTENLDLGTGAVTMSGNRAVTVTANTLTVSGPIGGGAVGLTKLGSGTLNLKGTHTFSGDVAVNAGTLALSPAGALSVANTITGSGILNINPGTTNLSLTGNLSGFTGTINVAPPVASPGKLVTAASNPLAVGTIVNVASGGTWFSNGTTQSGITLNLAGTGNAEGFGALRIDTGSIDSTSSIVLQADSSIGGNTSSNSATIDAVISQNVGPFGLTKVGVNNIFLGGANSYSGPTVVNAGSLNLTHPSALGTSAGGTTVANGARVALDDVMVTGEAISIRGNGSNNLGALQGRSGDSEWDGNVTIASATDTRIGAAAGASLEVSGIIDDGPDDHRIMYRVADTDSTVIVSGPNTYTGGTTIVGTGPVIASSLNKVAGGTLFSNFGAPVTEANGLIIMGTGAVPGILRYVGSGETTDRTFQIGVNSATPIAGDTGSATIENNGATGALLFSGGPGLNFNTPTNAVTGTSPARTLTLGGTNANANTISGIIQNNQVAGSPTAAVTVTKADSGSWTLSAINTYTGPTVVRDGTLTLSGGFTGAGNRTITVSDTAGLSAILNITGGTYALGTGQINVGNAPTTAATGTVNQSGGAISFSGGNGLLVGQNTVANQGVYNLSAGSITTFASTTRGILLGVNPGTAGGTFNLSGTGVLNMTAATGGGGDAALMIGRFDAAAGNTTNLFNQTDGTANVGLLSIGGNAATSTGVSSTLTLTGGTFVANQFPRLALGNDNTAVINIGGTADVTLPAFPTARGTGTTTATINFDGGTLKPLAASATYMGGLTNAFIKAGGVRFDTTNGSITITQALLADGVSTGGGLTKDGTNTLTLTGSNTYIGNTTVNAGTLELADNAQLKFVLGASGTNNSISGAGTVSLDGDFVIDTTAADALPSGTWTLVNMPGPYGTNFTIVGFDDAGDDMWTKTSGGKTYTFDEDTGVLILGAASGYSSWADLNGAGPNLDDDHDFDGVANGVEYFIGGPNGDTTGFTLLPGVADMSGILSVSWPKGADYAGDYTTDFVVETSTTLSGPWTAETIPGGNITDTPNPGGSVKYTFPGGPGYSGKNFARLRVTGP